MQYALYPYLIIYIKMYLELKKMKLRFIKGGELKVGCLIGRHNIMSINKYDIGYLEGIKDEPLGFKYGIRELDTNKLFHHHISTIEPILPILISDDIIEKGDFFYIDKGFIYKCTGKHKEGKLWIIESNEGEYLAKWVKKVMAKPEEFGWSYNDGPPHDHNFEWRGKYLEDYKPISLLRAIKDRCRLLVVVEEVCPNYGGSHYGRDCNCKSGFIIQPKLYENKIIMDTYGLLKVPNQGFYTHK